MPSPIALSLKTLTRVISGLVFVVSAGMVVAAALFVAETVAQVNEPQIVSPTAIKTSQVNSSLLEKTFERFKKKISGERLDVSRLGNPFATAAPVPPASPAP